ADAGRDRGETSASALCEAEEPAAPALTGAGGDDRSGLRLERNQLADQLADAAADLRLGVGGDEGRAAVDRGAHRLGIVGDLQRDGEAEVVLHRLLVELGVRVGAVE